MSDEFGMTSSRLDGIAGLVETMMTADGLRAANHGDAIGDS